MDKQFFLFQVLAALSCLIFAGCSADKTQLVVVVDSNLTVPSELAQVSVKVTTGVGNAEKKASEEFVLDDENALPLSFGVAPVDGTQDSEVVISVIAFNEDGDRLFTRRVETSFQTGKSRLLHVYLASQCGDLAAKCPAGQTCTENGCELPKIDAEDLPEAPGEGDELQYDAGLHRDAATSVSSDSGVGPDAASAPEDAAMDAGVMMDDSGVANDADTPEDTLVLMQVCRKMPA